MAETVETPTGTDSTRGLTSEEAARRLPPQIGSALAIVGLVLMDERFLPGRG